MELLTVKDAAFSYDGNVVVEGLNFSVSQGDYLCVVGENGSGKSTLLKGLLRLKAPASGSVTYADSLRRGDVGYLPQQTAAQKDFPASAWEVVLSGRLSARGLRPFYSPGDRRIAAETMLLLGVSHLRRRCYRELSGGQQQRVLLARALCATRSLLLLDEPVAGLDPVATGEMYRAVAALNREQGITVIMVSHDIRGVTGEASHILHLQGSQRFYGTTRQYLATELGRGYVGGEGCA